MKKEKPITHIHIGAIIKAKAAEKCISETQLAQLINCHISTIHYLYKKKCINTDLLSQISEALNYNFFTEVYGNYLFKTETNTLNNNVITIVITSEKIIVEQKNGDPKITEYLKINE
jgi:plasmid maintenance system antidote protein VapI